MIIKKNGFCYKKGEYVQVCEVDGVVFIIIMDGIKYSYCSNYDLIRIR